MSRGDERVEMSIETIGDGVCLWCYINVVWQRLATQLCYKVTPEVNSRSALNLTGCVVTTAMDMGVFLARSE